MKISYDMGQVRVELHEIDSGVLANKKKIKNDSGYVTLGSHNELHRDRKDPTKLVGATISEELFTVFGSITDTEHQGGRAAVERIGTMFSIELIKAIN